MNICEIYKSINGESTLQGLLTVLIRTWGCNLNCSYCDTVYARENRPDTMSISQIQNEIESYKIKNILITGGEPLLQEDIYKLIASLEERKYKIAIETNGSILINKIPNTVKKIIDVKCPASKESGSFIMENINFLSHRDEVKFVISTREDYDFARSFINKYLYSTFQGEVLFSPVIPSLDPKLLAEWIIYDNLFVRFQMQIHKILWKNKRRV